MVSLEDISVLNMQKSEVTSIELFMSSVNMIQSSNTQHFIQIQTAESVNSFRSPRFKLDSTPAENQTIAGVEDSQNSNALTSKNENLKEAEEDNDDDVNKGTNSIQVQVGRQSILQRHVEVSINPDKSPDELNIGDSIGTSFLFHN